MVKNLEEELESSFERLLLESNIEDNENDEEDLDYDYGEESDAISETDSWKSTKANPDEFIFDSIYGP